MTSFFNFFGTFCLSFGAAAGFVVLFVCFIFFGVGNVVRSDRVSLMRFIVVKYVMVLLV